jgi:coenzyme F420-reducing hydrogenase gamma subunit
MAKLSVAWFTFSCCEDSTILFTELLNDHYREWMQVLDIRTCLVLQKAERWDPVDVAFVEGAIASSEQEEKLKKIRVIAKRLVAIGACAVTGMPSAQRNSFDDAKKAATAGIIRRFNYSSLVKKVSDVVAVDAIVPGCPMDETAFLTVLNKSLADFGIRTAS